MTTEGQKVFSRGGRGQMQTNPELQVVTGSMGVKLMLNLKIQCTRTAESFCSV